MKQLIFMILLTAFGAFGALFNGPFWGLSVYYLFAVLRPQFLWKWALPTDIQWSLYVAVPTILAAALQSVGFYPDADENASTKRFALGHAALLGFVVWLLISYILAYDQDRASKIVIEYVKIFIMIGVSTIVVRQLWQIWVLYFMAILSLIYIAYEVNFFYFVDGYLGIYFNGYGGLDNNGAGLMLAMAVPACIFIWESHRKIWRWFFAAMVPVLVHAVLMTYSRGAMVALLVTSPLIFLRSRRKRMMILGFVAMACIVPVLAGPEIRNRFFSVQQFEEDKSAQSRLSSWRAGYAIAKDYPLFGIGPRNSPLVILKYGGDSKGRVIHSQYIQIAADTGFGGVAWYLGILGCTWLSLWRVRRRTRRDVGDDGRRIHALASALECALAVFFVGAIFLSVEVFELPWMLIMLSLQLSLVAAPATVTSPARGLAPATPLQPAHAMGLPFRQTNGARLPD